MSVVDTTERTLQVKIVYYGPGLSGKTTNLEQLSQQLNPERRGDLMVLDTVGDRTLFFDWMPVDLGRIRGFDVKIQLYTVPGQVRYNNTRKRVLAGVDGIVFVADSQAEALDQNEFSLQNLKENLQELGLKLEDIPLVVQYNKRDLPSALPMEDLAEHLGLEWASGVESVASKGVGVLETLRLVTRLTLQAVKDELDPNKAHRRSADVPMDGQALLAELMRGQQEEDASERAESVPGETADSEQSSSEERDQVEEEDESVQGAEEEHIVMEAELPDEHPGESAGDASPSYDSEPKDRGAVAGAGREGDAGDDSDGSDLARRLAAVEGLVTGMGLRVDELAEQADHLASSMEDQPGLEELQTGLQEVSENLKLVQRVTSSLGGKLAMLERRVDRLERADTDPVRSEHVRRLSTLLATVSDALGEYAAVLRPAPEDYDSDSSDEGGIR